MKYSKKEGEKNRRRKKKKKRGVVKRTKTGEANGGRESSLFIIQVGLCGHDDIDSRLAEPARQGEGMVA